MLDWDRARYHQCTQKRAVCFEVSLTWKDKYGKFFFPNNNTTISESNKSKPSLTTVCSREQETVLKKAKNYTTNATSSSASSKQLKKNSVLNSYKIQPGNIFYTIRRLLTHVNRGGPEEQFGSRWNWASPPSPGFSQSLRVSDSPSS